MNAAVQASVHHSRRQSLTLRRVFCPAMTSAPATVTGACAASTCHWVQQRCARFAVGCMQPGSSQPQQAAQDVGGGLVARLEHAAAACSRPRPTGAPLNLPAGVRDGIRHALSLRKAGFSCCREICCQGYRQPTEAQGIGNLQHLGHLVRLTYSERCSELQSHARVPAQKFSTVANSGELARCCSCGESTCLNPCTPRTHTNKMSDCNALSDAQKVAVVVNTKCCCC